MTRHHAQHRGQPIATVGNPAIKAPSKSSARVPWMPSRASALPLLLSLVLSACSPFPKDPDGTTQRVTREGAFRVGQVSNGRPAASASQAFLDRVEKATGARANIEMGSTEALLTRLEAGDLDLVVGEFIPSTPWKGRVHFMPELPRAGGPGERPVRAVAIRNGENGWASLLHDPARVMEQRP